MTKHTPRLTVVNPGEPTDQAVEALARLLLFSSR